MCNMSDAYINLSFQGGQDYQQSKYRRIFAAQRSLCIWGARASAVSASAGNALSNCSSCSCGLFPSCMPNQRTPNVKDLSLTRKRPRLWQVHLCFPVQEGFETPLVHLQEEEPPSHLTPWPTALQNADLPRSGASSATRTVLVHVCSDGSTLAM